MLRALPSVDELRRVLDYDPATGVFRWCFRPEFDARWNGRFAGAVAGNINLRGYRTICIRGVAYLAHRIAFKIMTGQEPDEIDHIDRACGNNRIANLRAATRAINLANRSAYRKRSA